MKPLKEALDRVLFAGCLKFKNLSVTPLVALHNGEPDYLSLDEALASGDVHVTETSEAGEVPELRLENHGASPVLLLDGEELVGAKQNRVLNLTILAPARTTIRIPVSCVEQRRWSWSTQRFGTADRTIYAEGRAQKANHVTDSLRTSGTRRSRQTDVWENIRAKSARMGNRSGTEAMAGIYEDHDAELRAYVRAIQPVQNQVGAVFAVDDEVRGVELFDFSATLRRLYPKLVRSYALDAVEGRKSASSGVEPDPRPIIAAVTAAEKSEHGAVGEGTDIRLTGDHLTGGGLVARDRLVHLCAFRLGDSSARPTAESGVRRDRNSRRSAGRDPSAGAGRPANVDTLNGLFNRGAIALDRSGLFDEPVSPKASGFDFSRVEGMLLGLAIGDALGITTEGRLPESRRAHYGEIRDYLPNRYVNEIRGFPSDDTQLSFWALEQMIADREYVPEHMARRFCAGHIFGIGQTMRGFLGHFKEGRPWYACGPASAGNGALMRIAPVLIPHLRTGGTRLWSDAALAAMMTHNDRASTAACVAFVAMLWELLDMDRPPAPAWWIERYVDLARGLEGESSYSPRSGAFMKYRGPVWRFTRERVSAAAARRLSVLDACNAWHSGAYLMETLPSVLYILMRHGEDPEEAIVRAVNDTRDNDTVAAIVGAAVGALHGRRALPTRWIRNLSGRTTDRDDGRVFELIGEARRVFWD